MIIAFLGWTQQRCSITRTCRTHFFQRIFPPVTFDAWCDAASSNGDCTLVSKPLDPRFLISFTQKEREIVCESSVNRSCGITYPTPFDVECNLRSS